jgi:hypothetical protein
MHMSQSLLSTITDLALNKTDTGKKGQRATPSSRISGVVHDDRRHEWVVPQLRRYASATPQRLRYIEHDKSEPDIGFILSLNARESAFYSGTRTRKRCSVLVRRLQFTLACVSDGRSDKPRRYFRSMKVSPVNPAAIQPQTPGHETGSSRKNAFAARSQPRDAPQGVFETIRRWLQKHELESSSLCIRLLDDYRHVDELLQCFWNAVEDVAGGSSADVLLALPPLPSSLASALIGHLRECADVGDVFGSHVFLNAYGPDEGAPRFCLRLRKGSSAAGGVGATSQDDPFWSDDEDDFLDPRFAELLRASREEDAGETSPVAVGQDAAPTGITTNDDLDTRQKLQSSELSLPSDEVILAESRAWVQHMIVDAAVCPFMMSAVRGGLPAGQVRYAVSHVTTPERIYREFWNEVALLRRTPSKDVSTTLLVLPELVQGIEGFDAITTPLSAALEALQLDAFIQLVFFHPKYAFRDGRDRINTQGGTGGHAANYVRRSPYPMINILRTEQVQRGQRGIPTELVYRRNESLMRTIGAERLEQMLRRRSWEELLQLVQDNRPYADLEEAVKRVRDQFASS